MMKMLSSDGKQYLTEGGHVARTARKELEAQIGRSIVSP
jgi:hypothetical protein